MTRRDSGNVRDECRDANDFSLAMKWKTPEVGTTRSMRVFLLFPCTIGDECRWLEFATIVRRWNGSYWTDRAWSDYDPWPPPAIGSRWQFKDDASSIVVVEANALDTVYYRWEGRSERSTLGIQNFYHCYEPESAIGEYS